MRRRVVSFPKSGRTWLRVMMDALSINAEYTHAQSDHRKQNLAEDLRLEADDKFDRTLVLIRDHATRSSQVIFKSQHD